LTNEFPALLDKKDGGRDHEEKVEGKRGQEEMVEVERDQGN
jgi:hypothetical protein